MEKENCLNEENDNLKVENNIANSCNTVVIQETANFALKEDISVNNVETVTLKESPDETNLYQVNPNLAVVETTTNGGFVIVDLVEISTCSPNLLEDEKPNPELSKEVCNSLIIVQQQLYK